MGPKELISVSETWTIIIKPKVYLISLIWLPIPRLRCRITHAEKLEGEWLNNRELVIADSDAQDTEA